jgi:hypothetical protein
MPRSGGVFYGHLELNLFADALAHTDDAIRAATPHP